METVNYVVEGRRAKLWLNRSRQMNALSRALRTDLLEALRKAEADDHVRVVILGAEGRAFCAGADLVETANPAPGEIERQLNEEYGAIVSTICAMKKPVICVVQGVVAGAGCALPLAADLTVMAEEAYLYPAFGAVGLVPDGGVSWLLQKQLGSKRAFQLCLENTKLPAVQCLELGLVNRVVPAGQLMDVAEQWAMMVEDSAPLVPGYLKQLLGRVADTGLTEAMALEATLQDELVQTQASRERVAAVLQGK